MIFDPQSKILWHGSRVSEWLRCGKTRPVLFEVAPVGYCNAMCPWCFFKDKHESSVIDQTVMLYAIQEMKGMDVKSLNWSGGGEPTLHPNFHDFVAYTDSCDIEQGLFTNGIEEIPLQDVFKWIRISLTDKGLDVITRPSVKFGICLNQTSDHSEAELRSICQDSKKFGASYFQVRPALLGNYLDQPRLFPPQYLKEYEDPGFKVYVTEYKYTEAIRPKAYDKCFGFHFCPSIDWEGNVSVCMYLTNDPEYRIGNLNNDSLIDILHSAPAAVMVCDNCQNCCKNHEINKILFAARNVREINFI